MTTQENIEETYPSLREKVRELTAETGLLAELRQHQDAEGFIPREIVLGIARDMLQAVKEELVGPDELDGGIGLTDVECYDGDRAKQVTLTLPAERGKGGEAYIATISRGPGADFTLKFGASAVIPEKRERLCTYSTAELLGGGKLEETLIQFLRWYAEGCPLTND